MALPIRAQWSRPRIANGVGIDQNLDHPLPLDAVFRDEQGQVVPLRTYFGEKPVLIELVYFKCTSLCPKSIYESVSAMKRVSLEPGRDYEVVIVSFDPKDTPADALQEKRQYETIFGRPSFNAGWHFLTGSQDAITRLTKAIGFRYRWDSPTSQFVHAGGIMVATPEGKLSRYFYGIQYAPQDLRMALVDASRHKIGSPVDYFLLFCFHYDELQGKYTLAIINILKLAGGATLLALILLIYFLMRSDRNKPQRRVT
ncbi:MAG: SCO family protein, partial [Acidobacteriaceae bacterium]|nr:SCO family protein [Acidobacteriaceae bacterium]